MQGGALRRDKVQVPPESQGLISRHLVCKKSTEQEKVKLQEEQTQQNDRNLSANNHQYNFHHSDTVNIGLESSTMESDTIVGERHQPQVKDDREHRKKKKAERRKKRATSELQKNQNQR